MLTGDYNSFDKDGWQSCVMMTFISHSCHVRRTSDLSFKWLPHSLLVKKPHLVCVSSPHLMDNNPMFTIMAENVSHRAIYQTFQEDEWWIQSGFLKSYIYMINVRTLLYFVNRSFSYTTDYFWFSASISRAKTYISTMKFIENLYLFLSPLALLNMICMSQLPCKTDQKEYRTGIEWFTIWCQNMH